MARGVLDQIGEQVFTTGKIRKAIDKLFMDPPNSLIKLIRLIVKDDSIKPNQVKESLKRIWLQTSENEITSNYEFKDETSEKTTEKEKEYDEEYHIGGKPQEVLELFKTIDNFCRNFDPVKVKRKYLAKYVKYNCGKNIFCCVHLQKSGLRVWLKLNYSELENPPEYVRDVSKIGHWGVGDVELTIDSIEKFHSAKYLIQKSFEKIYKVGNIIDS
jgi:hypothetical protein